MRSIRIGKNISFTWNIPNKHDEQFDKDKFMLMISGPYGYSRVIEDFTYDKGTISWVFNGTDQKYLGNYGFTLWTDKGGLNQSVVDSPSVFRLVSNTKREE